MHPNDRTNFNTVSEHEILGDRDTFSGLELDELLAAKDAEPRCGMMVIDLTTGAIVHWLRFSD